MYDYKIDYNEQMLNYYPEVIKAIREFQALIFSQSLEVEEMNEKLTQILSNAYVSDCDETTIGKWEKVMGITPIANSSMEDRRETILARLYSTPKLNSQSIDDIVKIFTGGETESRFDANTSTIHILISPPPYGKSYQFENVKQELSKKIPAHLQFEVTQNYYTWAERYAEYPTWGDIYNNFSTWGDVLLKYKELPNLFNLDEATYVGNRVTVTKTNDGFDMIVTESNAGTRLQVAIPSDKFVENATYQLSFKTDCDLTILYVGEANDVKDSSTNSIFYNNKTPPIPTTIDIKPTAITKPCLCFIFYFGNAPVGTNIHLTSIKITKQG